MSKQVSFIIKENKLFAKLPNQTQDEYEKSLAMRISWSSIIVNAALSLLKLTIGLATRSSALISDAIHSASDVLSTVAVMIGITVSKRKADNEHPYGHERLECVASIVLAMLLGITGLGIGYDGITKILEPGNATDVPGSMALIAALVSIVVKEIMYQYTKYGAKLINSSALMADAWHHRSDALSSIAAFAGILGARMGYPQLDPVAGIVICGFIIKASLDIFIDAVNKMVDHSCPAETVDSMKKVILSVPNVQGIDDIKTRLFGSKIYVEVEVSMDANLSLREAHNYAEEVHDIIEKTFPGVKHCMVHVNPSEEQH